MRINNGADYLGHPRISSNIFAGLYGWQVMARPSGEKTRCNGQWTEAKYVNFIKNLLRSGTRKWAPVHSVMRKAKVSRGLYLCAGCEEEVPVTVVDDEKKRRVKNVFVDHIDPIVDPTVGFTTWDEFIARMFCEEDNLQVLCKKCHDNKTSEERTVATERRRQEKVND